MTKADIKNSGGCAGCDHFDFESSSRDGYGLCKVESPRVNRRTTSFEGIWPVVKKSDWCKQFEAVVVVKLP